MPPDLEVDADGTVTFSGVGFVADVERATTARGRQIEDLTVEPIEIRLTN